MRFIEALVVIFFFIGVAHATKPAVSLSQDNNQVGIKNPDTVFELVFDSLPDQVTIHPSEHSYYFSFNANQHTIWGNLRLEPSDKDKGIVHLGYFEYAESGKIQDIKEYDKNFTAKDGVVLTRKAKFHYSMKYKNRQVNFFLNSNDLQVVGSCRQTFADKSEFYACITPDRM